VKDRTVDWVVRNALRTLDRLGIWWSTALIGVAISVMTNAMVALSFWWFEQPWYIDRPAYGIQFFLLPFLVSLPVSLLGFLMIQRLRRAEAEAVDSEAKFRNLAEGSVQGICIQRQFEPLYCNKAFADIFGFDSVEDALSYGPMHTMIPEPVRPAVVSRRMREQPGFTREAVHPALRKDGSEIWVESYIQRVMWGGEEAVQITVLDVSERRQVERMKNEFVSTVSHELRTPLTSIKGALALLESGMVGHVSDRAKEIVGIAANNSDRLIRLINDILDIERIEAGRISLRAEKLDAVSLSRLAIDQAIGIAHTEGVSLVLAGSRVAASVRGDRDQLLQVFSNLISNAIKFAPQGGEVVLRVEPRGDVARFSVTDNGPGVPDEFRARIFERFTQADSSTSRRHGGTGLGLNICKLIVERHDGRIGFESEPDVETTFWFDIPRYADEAKLAAE
jgi:PAS domain S-box-containing protein